MGRGDSMEQKICNCVVCGEEKECISWVVDGDIVYVCDDCINRMLDIGWEEYENGCE